MADDVTQDTVTPEAPAPEAPVEDSPASLTDAIAGAATGFESDNSEGIAADFDPTSLAEPASDDDTPAQEAQPSPDETATEGEEKPTTSDDADASDDDEDAPDGYTVDMPVVREGQEDDVIQLTGLPQETADTLKHYFKESARVPGLEAQLAESRQDSATIEFMQENPGDAFHWLEQAEPEAGKEFTRSWIARHPEDTLDIIAELRLTEMDPDTMRIRAENERFRTENRIRESQVKFDQTTKTRAFVSQSSTVIKQVANTLGLDFSKLPTKTFMEASAQVLGKMPTTATRQEMTFALQDLTREMAAIINQKPQTVAVGSPNGETPPDDGQPRDDVTGKFKAKVDAQAKHRKLAGGRTVVTPINAIKQRGVGTIEEAIKRFRD